MKFLFRTLVNQNQRLVYSQAMHILANRSDAEDATQEAYERLWKHMNKPQQQNELNTDSGKAWLLHVVRNLCIDKLRQRKPISNHDLDELQSDSSDSKPVAMLAKKQLSAWLSSAIEKLKEPYRSLIILADLQQRSIRDVANTLDLNENQAKVYIHRGRKQLRVLLQGVEL
ncbi:MAG: RNA polymerase sigma-70 factor (ECF subfamily) [Cryomorphaceae bacterium]|jgi:RNA polymerase sigma-70 factor (ECF subfamily)